MIFALFQRKDDSGPAPTSMAVAASRVGSGRCVKLPVIAKFKLKLSDYTREPCSCVPWRWYNSFGETCSKDWQRKVRRGMAKGNLASGRSHKGGSALAPVQSKTCSCMQPDHNARRRPEAHGKLTCS